MKKITLLILTFLLSFSGFSQVLNEGFEGGTFPPTVPGNWAVFQNGFGSNVWTTNTVLPHTGTTAAQINSRQNIGMGNTSKDFLATPLVTVPTNGQLRFWSRSAVNGNQGTKYQVRIAPFGSVQTDEAAYTILVQEWTEDELSTTYNIYEEKVVDLTAYAGQQIYIAFVDEYTQASTTLSGDSWLLDDVLLVSRCLDPTTLTANPVTFNSATLGWNNPSGATSWEIEVMLAGPALPTGSGTVVNTNPYTVTTLTAAPFTPLQPLTSYKFYVRSLCTFSGSLWVGPFTFTTPTAPPVCGGNFVDTGGTTANYPNNADSTVTICPVNVGDVVTVTFTAFNTQASNDGLYVFNGNSITAPQISSSNPAGTVPGGLAGSYWGTVIPGPFTSSSPDGCLTFRFRSGTATTAAGWTSNVTCAPAPVCPAPYSLTASTVMSTSATLGWTNAGPATAWEVIALPCGTPAPTATTTGWIAAPTNPFVLTGLNSATCYDFYVRAVCSPTENSEIAGPVSFTTQAAPPVCGGNFVDEGGLTANYANNSDSTVTICPVNVGDVVTVTFTSFNTQASNDGLYVFNGNSIAAPQISSGNPAGTVPGGLAGSYWGTVNPGSFTSSSPDGCLTFRFRSGAATNAAGWVANVTCAPAPVCPAPFSLLTSTVTSTTVNLAWTNGGSETAWEVIALPCGSPAPTATSVGTPAPTNPFVLTGLNPDTCYILYVRAVCSATESSSWTGPQTITTQIAPPACGGQYVDAGGISANYPNNSDSTITICPTIPGQQVTVTFTSFNTETNWDGLYVFDGNSIASPQIASANPAANVPGGLAGSYWGTAIPGPFTSSSADGCLTFRFRSDGSVNNPGWVANVTCAPAPTCAKPTILTTTAITATSVTLGWIQPLNPDGSQASAWEVLVLPCGSPAPTATSTGWIAATTNSLVITGLASASCFDFYVRAVCSPTDSSTWAGPKSATTPVAPPVCGGNFVDVGGISANYPNNSDSTITICPTNPGDIVTVTFTSFDTEANWDGLYVFDGNSIASPQIASANPAANVPGGLAGSYWGTAIPGPFESSSVDGCLTFRFRSDGSVNRPGWVANVTCLPPPTCIRPNTLSATNITQTSALLSWNQPINPDGSSATAWQIIILPAGSPAPLPGDTGIAASVNPILVTGLQPGQQYVFYVMAVCSATDSSVWSTTGFNFNTLPGNDECAGATFVPVNSNSACNQFVTGTISGATASGSPALAPCIGNADDDVWFQFIATNSYLNVSLTSVVGSTANLNHAVYSGGCGGLTLLYCSAANALSSVANGLIVGNTYYIRVYSNASTPQTSTFNLCISTPSTCANSSTVCNTTYNNTVGVTSLGTIGCLFSSPNPSFFTIQILTSGPISYLLTQSSPGSPTPNLDVDYAAWGPFTSQNAGCTAIGGGQTPLTGLTTGCSYSAAPTETFNIPNAIAGQYYIILITNFSNQTGVISLTQTNLGAPGAGQTFCCPDANFSYTPTAYCKTTSDNPIAVIAPAALAGVFSTVPPNPNLVFVDTATGEINLAASAPGIYVIRNTLLATTSCAERYFDFTITISEPVSATIDYGAASYCSDISTPQPVSQSGTAGGTYSAQPLGLYIDTMTGSITPSLSAPGVYQISYNIFSAGACASSSPNTQVEIIAQPSVPVINNVTVCDSYILPALTVGNYFTETGGTGTPLFAGNTVTTTQTIYVYAANGSCTDEESFIVTINTISADAPANVVACTSYTLPDLSANNNYYTGPNGTGTLLNAGDVLTTTQTLYVFAQTGTTPNCTDENSFTITIGDIIADVVNDVTVCDSYTLPGLSPDNNYFTGSGGTGTPLFAGNAVTTTQTIYVYAQLGTCTDETDFVVTVNVTPVIPVIANVIACESYTLPTLTVGNYFTGAGGTGTPLSAGNVITTNQTIYVYAQTGSTPNCSAERSFTVTLTTSPVVVPIANVSSCDTYTLPTLTVGNYFTGSNGTGTALFAGNAITTTQTLYVYAQSGTTPNCTDEESFEVVITSSPEFAITGGCIGNAYVLEASVLNNSYDPANVTYSWGTTDGDIVANGNTSTVTVSGSGTYTLTVSTNSLIGCSESVSFLANNTTCLIPKGISPNNDGLNDSFDLEGFNVTKLQIFNRYGSKVYSHGANYTDQWHGQSDKGDELPDGTYYYVIERNTGETKTGWIYINR